MTLLNAPLLNPTHLTSLRLGVAFQVSLAAPCLSLTVASCLAAQFPGRPELSSRWSSFHRSPHLPDTLIVSKALGTSAKPVLAAHEGDATNMSKDTEGKSEKIMDMDSKVLWYPDSKRNTQMDKFRIQVNGDYGLNLGEQGGGRDWDTWSTCYTCAAVNVGRETKLIQTENRWPPPPTAPRR